jgi:hypothetical protein
MMPEEFKLHYKCGSKRCECGCGGAYGGVWESARFSQVWGLESGFRFCIGASFRHLASVAVKKLSHSIDLTWIFYEFLNAICKGNGAVNCITLQQIHKKVHSRQLLRRIC